MDHVFSQSEQQGRDRYYGKYRGFVSDNQDPEQRARLRLVVPSVLAEEVTGWALPCLPFGGMADAGFFTVPEVDAQVWVEFEEGHASRPIWTGTFWQASGDPPAEAAVDPPTTRVLKTVSGHVLQFDDKEDEERILLAHPEGAQLEIDPNGTVAITAADGATVTLDADAGSITVSDANGNVMEMTSSGTTVTDSNGNEIEMAAAGVTVKGQKITIEGSQVLLGGAGGEPVIKGQTFLSLFMTHMHPSAMGPTGPPIPQGEMSSLSSKVMSA